MPKITINEIDLTTRLSFNPTENIVYIPCKKIGDNGPVAIKLVETVADLKETFLGSVDADLPDTKTEDGKYVYASFIMAAELLAAGMHVLFQTFDSDSFTTTDGNGSFDHLKDKSLYDFKYFTYGAQGFAGDDTNEIGYALNLAAARGDCCALLCDEHGAFTNIQALGNALVSTDADNGTYGAFFYPWGIYNVSTVDFDNVCLPATFGFLYALAKSSQYAPNWYATAGATRGALPTLVSVEEELGEMSASIYQPESPSSAAINLICNVRPFGYCIWGNRTMYYKAGAELSARSFLNIRKLVCDVKKTLFQASRQLTFEQNSDLLWANFKAKVSPLLEQMKTGNGLRDYKIIKDVTSKSATLKATVRLFPIEAVEFFDLTVELADSLSEVTE